MEQFGLRACYGAKGQSITALRLAIDRRLDCTFAARASD